MTKKKILILGGAGQMGETVSSYLNQDYNVTVGDIVRANVKTNVNFVKIDMSKPPDKYTISLLKRHDLIVNCLPSALGTRALKIVAYAGVDCIDLSFSNANPYDVDELARKNNCCIIPDAGLAPGLSNLWVGREQNNYNSAIILVGGISKSPFEPFGYAATWSVEDLLEEYIRPARYKKGGDVFSIDPFVSKLNHEINGVRMESFAADGLRTLLNTDMFEIMERTLRWPGHIDAVKPLVENGTFVDEIRSQCTGIQDTVVFRIEFMKDYKTEKVINMIHHGDNLSAMAQTTGYTCAIVADMVLKNVYNQPGVHPLENVGKENKAFEFIADSLMRKNIWFEEIKQ